MASSFSTDLKIELMATGENSGTWGDKTNSNLNLVQQAIAGYQSIALTSTNTTLAMTNATISDARNAVLEFTGTITANCTIFVESGIEKTYLIKNSTSGAFTIALNQVGGSSVIWAAADKSLKNIYLNGTNATDTGLVSETGVATLTNKTLTSPTINTATLTAPIINEIDDNAGNEFVIFSKTTTAVNEFTVTNAATGNAPEISATGGDTNIDLKITPKGSGKVVLDGLKYPNADGSANQVLKTDGSGNLSFATPSAGFSGATTTSSAVDITLTSASTQVQNVTMTAAGKAVILPNATTLATEGFPVFVITNQGFFPISIQNGAGIVITTLNTNTTLTLSLIDNSTSAGIYAGGTQPIFIGINPGTTINSGSTGVSTAGSFNEFFQGITCDKIDSTKVLVSYHKGTSNRDVYGRVITISGQSFSVASETILYDGSSTASVNSNVRMLDSTNGLLVVDRASNTVAVPFTVSGTTITVGTTSATFSEGQGASQYTGTSRTITLTSTLALISNRLTAGGTDWVYRTITHNGASAPTIGTASSSVVNYNYAAPATVRISDTQAFSVIAGTGVPIARVITVSGASAPTLQTANTTSTASYPDGHNQLIANSSTDFTFFRDARSTNYTVSGNTTTHVGDRESNFYNSNLTGSLSISKIAFGDYLFEYAFYGGPPFLNKRNSGFLAPITGSAIVNPYGNNLSGGITFATELDSITAFIVNSNSVDTLKGSIINYVGI